MAKRCLANWGRFIILIRVIDEESNRKRAPVFPAPRFVSMNDQIIQITFQQTILGDDHRKTYLRPRVVYFDICLYADAVQHAISNW